MAFSRTQLTERLAAAVAADVLTDQEIANEHGIHRTTLAGYKREPLFRAMVDEYLAPIREAALLQGIADRSARMARYNDRYDRIDEVIRQRAKDPQMQDVPGGNQGILVRNYRGIGRGEDYQVLTVYEFDSALLAEERNLAKQAAIEMGQWDEQGGVLPILVVGDEEPEDKPPETGGTDGT